MKYFMCLLLVPCLIGCSDEDLGRIRRISDKGMDQVGSAVRKTWNGMGQGGVLPANDSTLTGKVRSRLENDAIASGSNYQLTEDAGKIIVSGTIKEDKIRERIEELARTTLGVKEVEAKWTSGEAKLD